MSTQKRNLSLLPSLALLALLFSCAKDLPEKVSEEIKQNVFDKNLFNEEAYLEVEEDLENRPQLSEENGNITLLSQNSEKNVRFVGPSDLAVFFKDYKISGVNGGEKIALKFQLLKSKQLVVLAKSDQNNSNIAPLVIEGEKYIPLFQYPISAYGVLEKAKNDLGEETREVVFKAKNKEASTHVNISTLVSDRKLAGIKGLALEEQKRIFNKAKSKERTLLGKEIKSLFLGPEEFLRSIDDSKSYLTTVYGNYIYILEAATLAQLNPIEQSLLANNDPRFLPHKNKPNIIFRPKYFSKVSHIIFQATQDNQESLGETELKIVAPKDSNYFSLPSTAELSRVDLASVLDLENQNLIDLKNIDFDAEYVYVPSTLGTPRDVSVADPFYQGDEKIVKIKKGKEGLEVYQIEKDGRFSDNELNDSPVLTIPGEYVDYKCQRDQNEECTPSLERNNLNFKNKAFFLANFENLKLTEVNSLNVFTANDSCIIPTGKKLLSQFIAPGVINFELQDSYKYSAQEDCISDLFFDENLKAASFKVNFFYSLVRLTDLQSKDYKAVLYPGTEDGEFGFFKNTHKELGDQFDPNRKIEKTYLNRFNPNKKSIDYYLTETFFKAKNAIFKEATIKAIQGMNQSLERANAGIQINLITNPLLSMGRKVGDLRNNMIVLVDEPLANGLLGYAPSVSNPRTGEILQGRVNMYSGTIYSLTRSTYESMVDLSYDLQEKAIKDNAKALGLLEFDRFKNKSHFSLSANGKSTASLLFQLEQGALTVHRPDLDKILSKSGLIKKHQEKLSHAQIDKKLQAKLVKEGHITHQEQLLERCSHNNAFHEEFFNVGALGKTYFPGIKEIPGITDSAGRLKRYSLLNKEQRDQVAKIIAPAVYTSTLIHEFGHNLGLRHNFMGSTDRANFYSEQEAQDLGLKSASAYSSIMDYSFSELNELSVFGKYDIAALRFAYAREVQTQDGKFHSLPSTLTDFKEKLKEQISQLPPEEAKERKDLKLLDYKFCTDENAGLSTFCNRFDEGTNLVEITDHYTKKYYDNYRYRNFRDERDEYSQFGIFEYAASRFSEFKRIRNIFEDYEFFAKIFGDEAMSEGCGPVQMEKYPVCKDIEERRVAIKKVADFFLDILSTPDFLCATASIKSPKEIKEFKKLSKIYEEIKFDMDYIPSSCFDPHVVTFLEKDELLPIAEGGKFLTDLKGVDPRYPYKTDIDIRGVWSDKLLALRALVSRESLQGSSEEERGAIADLPYVTEKLSNLLSHLAVGEDLEKRIPFKDAKGLLVEVPYELAPTEALPEIPYPQFLRMFKLPRDGGSLLTEELLKTVALHSPTSDPKYKEKGRLNQQFVSVVKNSVFNNNAAGNSIVIKDTVYMAGSDNTLAGRIIHGQALVTFLSAQDKKVIQEVIIRRMKPTAPDGLSEDEKNAFKIELNILTQLAQLSERSAELNKDRIIAQFGEELGKNILKTYSLGSEFMKKIIKLKTEASSAPANATAEVKKIYSLPLESLQKFLTGKMQTEIDWGSQVLPQMPAAAI